MSLKQPKSEFVGHTNIIDYLVIFFYFNNDTLYISLVHCEANKTNIKYKMKEFT
jgi:hypothetical protein